MKVFSKFAYLTYTVCEPNLDGSYSIPSSILVPYCTPSVSNPTGNTSAPLAIIFLTDAPVIFNFASGFVVYVYLVVVGGTNSIPVTLSFT